MDEHQENQKDIHLLLVDDTLPSTSPPDGSYHCSKETRNACAWMGAMLITAVGYMLIAIVVVCFVAIIVFIGSAYHTEHHPGVVDLLTEPTLTFDRLEFTNRQRMRNVPQMQCTDGCSSAHFSGFTTAVCQFSVVPVDAQRDLHWRCHFTFMNQRCIVDMPYNVVCEMYAAEDGHNHSNKQRVLSRSCSLAYSVQWKPNCTDYML